MAHFTEEQKKKARTTDLYAFLINRHPEDFIREPNQLRFKQNKSICIHKGWAAYKDFSSGESGNPIDFLVRHMGYGIVDAVLALCGCGDVPAGPGLAVPQKEACPGGQDSGAGAAGKDSIFPERQPGSFRRLYAYLSSRGISGGTIDLLVNDMYIYEDTRGNIIFEDILFNWGEIRGTNAFAEKRCRHREGCGGFCISEHQWCSRMGSCGRYMKTPFHGILKGSAPDGLWCFIPGEPKGPRTAYVCEAGIDAISLYELHRLDGADTNGFYMSIGGAGKQAAIDRLLRDYKKVSVTLAVDNDGAGDECRKRNPALGSIVPLHKDWNEDLMARLGLKRS